MMRTRSNLLIDHVLAPPPPDVGDIWRVRKGTRRVRVLSTGLHSIGVENVETGRRTRIVISGFVATYVRETPAPEEPGVNQSHVDPRV